MKKKMDAPNPAEVTRILHAIRDGDTNATDQLLPLVYHELRRIAGARMAKTPPGQTLQPTALVHEAYMRLVARPNPVSANPVSAGPNSANPRDSENDESTRGWDGRAHFFGAAARAMRDILVDQARRKASLKRGGDFRRVHLNDDAARLNTPNFDTPTFDTPTFDTNADEILALNDALKRLETEDPEKAELVMLRYFAGLTAEETADAMNVSLGTVERRWRFVRAWLRKTLSESRPNWT